MLWLLTFPFWGSVAMLVLYSIWVQQERGGWYELCRLITPLFYLLDFILAHTVFAVCVWTFPRADEWTISEMLIRLIDNTDWRGNIARRLAWLLNAIAPSGKHI